MAYQVDQRDIDFILFEQLKISDHLTASERYKDYDVDSCKAILEGVSKFCESEIEPLNKLSDEQGCVLKDGQVKTPDGFPAAYQAAAELGLVGIDTPLTYGGQDMPIAISTVLQEYITTSCVSFGMYLGLTRGAAHLIEAFSEKKYSDLYVEKMYNGTWGGTMCLTEAHAGSAVGDISTTATPADGDRYKVKGSKIFISSGDQDITENIVHLVLARAEGDPAGTKGISLFAVPKIWVNEDGSLAEKNDVNTVNIEHKMGIKGSSTCTLSFGEDDNCYGYLVGERCKGMAYMFQMMNEARLACGVQGLSLGSAAYESALSYAKDRTQFGETLIIEYPDVKRMLITQKAYVEGMRALLYSTAALIDKAETEQDATKKEYYEGQVALLTPICKAYSTDQGFKVTELAIQTYGGAGYCSEYPVEQYMRDAKIGSIYEGTNGIQALDLIGRKLAQKQGQDFRNFYEEVTKFCAENAEHPSLGNVIASVKKSADQLGQITMKFAEWAMGGDRDYPMLQACNYLSIFGDVILGRLLSEQAVIALAELEKLWADNNCNDEASKSALCESNTDARYYESKVKTARFFAAQVLPQSIGKAKTILSEDRSALEIRL